MKGEYVFTYKGINDRKRKNLSILEMIRKKGTISRTDIARETGINIVSISNYIDGYIKKGFVSESGYDISTGGRRPELVSLDHESQYVIGLEIGPEKIRAVMTDLSLTVKRKCESDRPEGTLDIVGLKALDVISQIIEESGVKKEKIGLIGIGICGIIDIRSGIIHDTDPTRGRTKTNLFTLTRSMELKFGIRTLLGNDATCAVYGEKSYMPSVNIMDMLYIYSDVGCGIIINGDIYCGVGGSAGEIQLLLDQNGKKDKKTFSEVSAYGIRGVDLGIVEKVKKHVAKREDSQLLNLVNNDINKITKETIFLASGKGDVLAKEVLFDAALWLGTKVAYLINIFNPETVIIGGGIEQAGSVFMVALENQIKQYAYEEAFNDVHIFPSFLREDAVVIGAASLAVRELFLDA
ncbi:MAG: ROK family transcriptional regulator [Candidatus Omnitrophica bacterium]|nr:ROK family transcriptional regulator [Candidatus Omnitrophota bacterium]